MLIREIDRALEKFVRAGLPLSEEVGDVSFDAPERSWGAQLSRITVNLFLFDLAISKQPARPAQERVGADGRLERRGPLPMVTMGYLVSAWAGSNADEHELLSELLSLLATSQAIPKEHLDPDFPSTVQLALSQRESRRPGDLWQTLDSRLKPGLEIEITVPVTSQPWTIAPPAVERIAGLVRPRPEDSPIDLPRRTALSREPDGSLLAEAMPATSTPQV